MILMNGHQAGNSSALLVGASDEMTRPFWCHHEYVNRFGGHNLPKMNIEPMTKRKCIPLFEVGCYIVFIHGVLFVIRDQDHDDIGGLCCLRNRHHFQSILLCPLPKSTFLA